MFLERVAAIKIKMCSNLQNAFNFVSVNGGKLFCVLSSNKYKLERINKLQIIDFIPFYKTSQIVWNLGCTKSN